MHKGLCVKTDFRKSIKLSLERAAWTSSDWCFWNQKKDLTGKQGQWDQRPTSLRSQRMHSLLYSMKYFQQDFLWNLMEQSGWVWRLDGDQRLQTPMLEYLPLLGETVWEGLGDVASLEIVLLAAGLWVSEDAFFPMSLFLLSCFWIKTELSAAPATKPLLYHCWL